MNFFFVVVVYVRVMYDCACACVVVIVTHVYELFLVHSCEQLRATLHGSVRCRRGVINM
jgi:hypothetical protein